MKWHIGEMIWQSHTRRLIGVSVLGGILAIGGATLLAGWQQHGMAIYQALLINGLNCF
ncbi:hypothetical protein [Notoacmeibacter ruber]|uniref:hypothetical protein n=1 Tax=Notoacmeibacter ruber TaxID=2670375 RepID=UPI001313EAD6|nr:hypothetical protein [Notoacmeibacter ruber]